MDLTEHKVATTTKVWITVTSRVHRHRLSIAVTSSVVEEVLFEGRGPASKRPLKFFGHCQRQSVVVRSGNNLEWNKIMCTKYSVEVSVQHSIKLKLFNSQKIGYPYSPRRNISKCVLKNWMTSCDALGETSSINSNCFLKVWRYLIQLLLCLSDRAAWEDPEGVPGEDERDHRGRAVHQLGHPPEVQRHVHSEQGKLASGAVAQLYSML